MITIMLKFMQVQDSGGNLDIHGGTDVGTTF